MNNQVAGALKELAEQFKEAWPDHTGKYHFLIGAGHNIAKEIATPAPIHDAGEVVNVVAYMIGQFLSKTPLRKGFISKQLMTVAQHNRIVAALQARAVVMPERERIVAEMEARISGLEAMLGIAYCQKVGADSPIGLHCCDNYRDWLAALNYADHLASHAYDEEKERALFEAEFKAGSPLTSLHRNSYGRYIVESVQSEWVGWLRCAKSRAKAAGGAE